MKKFVTLFTDSSKEFKSVRTITITAMLAAIAVILSRFSINYGEYIRISFSGIANEITAYLFGPVVGGVFAGVVDIINYVLNPIGTFCPPLTLVKILGGVIYGCFFYKKKITIGRIMSAKFVAMLICNVFLNTLCLSLLYGNAFMAILPVRALKNLIMWPIDTVIFFIVLKALEGAGILRMVENMKIKAVKTEQ